MSLALGSARPAAPLLGARRPCHQTARPARLSRVAVSASLTVRPYTIRKGDTLSSICKKRDLAVEEVLELNCHLNPDMIMAGETILLPAGNLSARDREILEGIQQGSYRNYPVRAGENLEDIIDKRGISMKEFKSINPDVDTENLQANQVIRLPSDKFTVREQEMLTGSGIVPKEFFSSGPMAIVPSLVFGVILGAAGAYAYFTTKTKKEE